MTAESSAKPFYKTAPNTSRHSVAACCDSRFTSSGPLAVVVVVDMCDRKASVIVDHLKWFEVVDVVK